jgi:outer membrane protein TolC
MRTDRTASGLIAAVWSVSLALGQPMLQNPNAPPSPQGPNVALGDLVRLALERSPELAGARRAIDVLASKVAPAGALPDPELMFGQMNEGNPIPFQTLGTNGFSEVYIGFTQEFPFPGKRPLRQKVAELEAQAEESRFKLTRLRITSEVKSAFYDLYSIQKAAGVVSKERDLLDRLARIASTRYSVGRGIQQDVLDAQVEISKVQERLEILERRRQAAEALLNTLTYQPLDAPLGRLGEVRRSPLQYSLSELTALAAENYPLLEAQQKLVDREAIALELAKKEKFPDFGASFVYHNRGGLAPYWTIGATARIPLYFGRKQRHEIEAAAASLAQSRHAYDNTRLQAFYNIKNVYLMASTAERLLRLYDEGIIRQASFSLESAVANYEVGKVDFLTLMMSWRRVLDYEVTYYEQFADYQKALAQLEPLVGIELAKD